MVCLQVDEYDAWLHDADERQGKLAGHEDPVLQSATVDGRAEPIRRQFTRLKNIKKPKPPPAPVVNATDTNATDAKVEVGQNAQDETIAGNAGASASSSAHAHAHAGDAKHIEQPVEGHVHDEL